MKSLNEQMREAIEAAPMTRYALSKQTGVDQGLLSNFVNGKRRLSLATIEILADALGLEIVLRKRKTARK